MELSKEQVAHIAGLARLDLTDNETEKFATQLTDILQYVEMLNEVDTDQVEITTQITGLQNISREDQKQDQKDPHHKELLECSPNPVELNQIQVKGVMND